MLGLLQHVVDDRELRPARLLVLRQGVDPPVHGVRILTGLDDRVTARVAQALLHSDGHRPRPAAKLQDGGVRVGVPPGDIALAPLRFGAAIVAPG